MRRRIRAAVTMLVVLALIGGAALVVLPSPHSQYRLQAVFASAEGLFPGNTVDILGVPAGTVQQVTPSGDTVTVTLEVDTRHRLPAGVHAALVSPELLGEPSIELSPSYTGGPALAAGSTVPLSKTSVPISTDQLLRDLQSFLSQINPTATGSLITNLAQDVAGQGSGLNQLIGNASGTLQLLAQKGNDLGRLSGSLAQISGALRSRTTTITSLIDNYDTVSQVLASHQGQLGTAITDLAGATSKLSQFLAPNLQPLETDIAGVTTVGRNLSANLSSIDQTLSSAVILFAAAQRAYDPAHQWINLNDQLPAGMTVSVVTGLIRDRLAGICRRLLANHSTGLPPQTLATLATCGNPYSGFFDPLFSLIPPILNALTSGPGGGPSPSALESLLGKGLAMIPGAATAASAVPGAASQSTPVATKASSSGGASPSGGADSLNPPGASQLPAAPTVPTNTQANGGSGSGGLLGGLLNGL